MSHKTKGSPEEKLAIIQRYLMGEISAATAARLAGVDESSIITWVRMYKQAGSIGLQSTDKNREFVHN